MEATKLIELANDALKYKGGGEFDAPVNSPEEYKTVEVSASFDGHSVVIKFTDHASNPAQYRYNASAYDAETGELIATGNGGETWEDGLDSVHWQKVAAHFSK